MYGSAESVLGRTSSQSASAGLRGTPSCPNSSYAFPMFTMRMSSFVASICAAQAQVHPYQVLIGYITQHSKACTQCADFSKGPCGLQCPSYTQNKYKLKA